MENCLNLFFTPCRNSFADLLNKLDDPSANVRSLAIECLAELKVDHGDPMFSETSLFNVIESVLSKLILYLDDPYVKIRPILLGKN